MSNDKPIYDVPWLAGAYDQEREYYLRKIEAHQPELVKDPELIYGDAKLTYWRLVNEGLIPEGDTGPRGKDGIDGEDGIDGKDGADATVMIASLLFSAGPSEYPVGISIMEVGAIGVANGWPANYLVVTTYQIHGDRVVQSFTAKTGKTWQRSGDSALPTGWTDLVQTVGASPSTVTSDSIVRNVKDFGAKGDGKTDDLAAFNAAFASVVAAKGGMIYIPAGTYILSDEWNVWRANSPRIDLVIKGESQWTTFIRANFKGSSKALIKGRDPLYRTRSSPTSIYDIQLGVVKAGHGDPVLLDVFGVGESRFESVRFAGANNTHMRMSSVQNVRIRDVVSFYGGKHYNYKDTNSVTFTTSTSSNTITASSDIFSSNDPGRLLTLFGTNDRVKLKITSVLTPTTANVSLDATPTTNLTKVKGVFEPARLTTTAGSDQVSANAQVFTQDHVGCVIYIVGAKNGPYGAALLRATITEFVSSATVKLDVAADITVTRTEFSTPVIDFWTPSVNTTAGQDSNDVKVELLHVENYRGVGLVVQGAIFFHLNDFKIHGEHDPENEQASLSMMWFDDYSGIIGGEFDGAATGDHRILLCNMNDMLTVDWLASRRIVNEILFQVEPMTDAGGITEVRSFNSYGPGTSGDPYSLVSDGNTNPKLVFTGMANLLGDNRSARIYHGRNLFTTLNGVLVLRADNGSLYKLTMSNTGALTSAVFTE